MPIKKGKIGNALESVAPDHVIAVAADVFDETLNKYQSELNQQIGQAGQGTVKGAKVGSGSTISPDANGIVTLPNYTENATPHIAPSSTEVKNALGATSSGTTKYLREDGTWQVPDYADVQEYINVEATAQTTAVTDVLPATGSASIIYRVGNWNGTAYDATMYSEYSWKGSGYAHLSTKNYGIDKKPMFKSGNVVESGGIYEELYDVAIHDNVYVNNSGSLVSDNSCFVLEYVLDEPIKQGDQFLWSGIEYGARRALAFFDGDTFRDVYSATGVTRSFTISSGEPAIGSNIIKASFLYSRSNIAFVELNGVKLSCGGASKIKELQESVGQLEGDTFRGHIKYSEIDSAQTIGIYIRDKEEFQYEPFILFVSRNEQGLCQTLIDENSISSRLLVDNVWTEWTPTMASQISELTKKVDDIENISRNDGALNFDFGGLTLNGGVTKDHTYGHTDYIPIQAGDAVDLVYGTNNANILFVGYNASKGIVEEWSCINNQRSIVVPSSGGYDFIRMSFVVGYGASVTINGEVVWRENVNTDIAIAECNSDKQPMLTSLSRHRPNGRITPKKDFVLAHITDTHSDNWLVQRAVDFLNSKDFDSIDCLIHTGDIQYYQFVPDTTHRNETDSATAFDKAMNERNGKPALTCLGNHDVYTASSSSDIYNRFMKPMVDNGLLVLNTNIKANETWYYKDFADYSVRIIALNDFDPMFDGYTKPLSTTEYSPAQIQFLIDTLSSTPSGYAVIVASHFLPTSSTGYEGSMLDMEWNERQQGASAISVGFTQASAFTDNINPVVDILAAFKAKESLNKTYTYRIQSLQEHYGSVTVNTDFSQSGATLALVLNGHEHIDQIFDFPSHNNLTVVGMAGGLIATNTDSKTTLFREYNGKSQDALNVYCLRPELRRVYIVRIGADFRGDYKEQKTTYIDY